MTTSPEGISILNKLQITTKEVINYLEHIDLANEQVMKVLQKKPSLPGYDKLPWVIESKVDKQITVKLRNRKKLTSSETRRLQEILSAALVTLKKGHQYETIQKRTQSLQDYIKSLG